MADIGNKTDLDKLRSYSSAFSRKVFADILAYSDFSHLDWLHDKYDSRMENDYSYIDYLAYIYKTLSYSYRCEYVYKNELINQLLLKKYGSKNTIAFNEFKVGDSIVDLALMNGESKAFEIKTKLDTPKRLKKQMMDYRKIFNKCYIVVDVSECEYYANHIEDTTGIIALSYQKGHIHLDEYRPATNAVKIDSDVLIKCLKTDEYKNIVLDFFGELPQAPAYNMFDACKEKLGIIDSENLNQLFLQEIKKRKSATNNLAKVPRELRQIVLSLNLTLRNQQTLIKKLNNPVNSSHICTARI